MTAYFRGEKLDFLFIDGDHSYDGVKADFEMYAPMVRPGGLIAFHDINPDHRSLRGDRYDHLEETGGVPKVEGAISGDVPRFWSDVKGRYPRLPRADRRPESGRGRDRGHHRPG